jgi:hypothetical protein
MIKILKINTFLLLAILALAGCKQTNPNWKVDANQANDIHASMQKLTDVIVHDIFSPPVAARIYSYASIAAYEGLRHDYVEFKTLAGQLNELKKLPQPTADLEYCFPLASLQAFTTVGKALIFSEDKIEAYQQKCYKKFEEINMPADVYQRSIHYGDELAQAILTWADGDMYKQTRTYPKYSITDDQKMWKPTPPDYMDGIEPHWREIRLMVLDSARQFSPKPPTEFSTAHDSQFYKETMEVYNALQVADAKDLEERRAIAKFWDCNPYVSTHRGHVMFATKKIPPGGHWMGITKIVCEKEKVNMMQATEAYTRVSIALMDAFISCWDEKYRSNLVRPETVINENIDENWRPLLQTPPFPEHTSGHSVISRASAVALTELFGDNYAFVDDTEEAYGLPIRNFKSFYHASEEAAVSRLYGGIHYRPAIDFGVEQGQKVGEFIVQNLKTK